MIDANGNIRGLFGDGYLDPAGFTVKSFGAVVVADVSDNFAGYLVKI